MSNSKEMQDLITASDEKNDLEVYKKREENESLIIEVKKNAKRPKTQKEINDAREIRIIGFRGDAVVSHIR
jgi:hypothetical protein